MFTTARSGTLEDLQGLLQKGGNPSLCNTQGTSLAKIALNAKNYQVAFSLQEEVLEKSSKTKKRFAFHKKKR